MYTQWVLMRERGWQESIRDGDVIMEPAVKVIWLLTDAHNQGTWMPIEAGKGKGIDCSLELYKELNPADILIRHSSVRPNLKFWLENYKKINLCSFKPLSLWIFIIAAIENEYLFEAKGDRTEKRNKTIIFQDFNTSLNIWYND